MIFSYLSYSRKTSMIITYFENYIKAREKQEVISLYGNIDDICITLLINELQKVVPFNESKSFNISFSDELEIPLFSNSIVYTVNKKIDDFNEIECPVCKEKWKDNKTIQLNCGHKICRDCLFTILKSENKHCSMCRKDILE